MNYIYLGFPGPKWSDGDGDDAKQLQKRWQWHRRDRLELGYMTDLFVNEVPEMLSSAAH